MSVTKYSRSLTLRSVAAAAIFASLGQAAHAQLVITGTFTSNFNTVFGSNAAAAQAAWNYAASQFSANFTDPIHINISVDGVSGSSVFGQSNTFLNSTSYANLRSLLVADAKTTDDNTSVGGSGSVTAADPVSAAHTWWTSRAEAKAIGLISDDMSNDGTTKFGAGFAWNFSTSNRAVAGQYDFVGVCEHEISEVMGRLGLSGGQIGNNPNSYSVVDLFSYTGAGARGLTAGGGENFSIDNGTNLLKLYNNALSNGLDTRDWAPGTNDSFNQFSGSGVVNDISDVDLREMDVIGYDRKQVVPEPAPIFVLGIAALVFGRAFLRK